MPCRVSSTIVLDSATYPCAFFEYLRIALPEKKAKSATAGKIANMNKVSLKELIVISVIPPIISMSWDNRSARVEVSESCNKEMSDEIRLFSSPTLLAAKKLIGNLIRWLYRC